ncbi:MAG TPA: hypothetical protein DDY45_02945, partial [Verrucomicrobiales bacterium]|nr:hypothetical protein [Verrucomicrobiales bacterium]
MALDLTSFFKDPDWFHRFDEHVLAQGKKLSSPRFLSALNLEKVDDGYLLTGSCDDHDVEINLWPESDSRWEFDSSCTCEFGSFCPHAAAALLRASRPNTLTRLMRGGGTTGSPAQLQKEEAVV